MQINLGGKSEFNLQFVSRDSAIVGEIDSMISCPSKESPFTSSPCAWARVLGSIGDEGCEAGEV